MSLLQTGGRKEGLFFSIHVFTFTWNSMIRLGGDAADYPGPLGEPKSSQEAAPPPDSWGASLINILWLKGRPAPRGTWTQPQAPVFAGLEPPPLHSL